MTVGVLHRVAELAGRPAGYRPEGAARFTNLVQLPQIIGEIPATGPEEQESQRRGEPASRCAGPELGILGDVPVGDLSKAGGALLAEAIAWLRRGRYAGKPDTTANTAWCAVGAGAGFMGGAGPAAAEQAFALIRHLRQRSPAGTERRT